MRKSFLTGILIAVLLLCSQIALAIDFQPLYDEVIKLQGMDAYKFFESLPQKGVTGHDVIDFFINLPWSPANQQINQLIQDDGLQFYIDKYPAGQTHEGFVWNMGMGTEIIGPISKQPLKLPFTDYIPIPEGPIGDPNKQYRIGLAFHGFNHPWLLNFADAAKWEADRHSNVEITILDGEYDNAKQAAQIDTFISEKMDGILIWPMVEAPTGPPAKRAVEAGIPVVSIDRLTSFDGVNSIVTGMLKANGAQAGMYLAWKLAQEGSFNAKIVLLRKPLGATSDAVRTGLFLKVLSYFPEIEILKSYHDTDSREEAFLNSQAALQAFPVIDVFFGTGDHEALAALEATKMANRLNSRADNKKVIFISIDDSKEAITNVKNGLFEVNTPLTPLHSDIGVRVLLNILAGKEMPKVVTDPDLIMVTQNGDEIFGLKTLTPDEWWPYTFGPEM